MRDPALLSPRGRRLSRLSPASFLSWPGFPLLRAPDTRLRGATMFDEEELVAQYDQLRAWIARERVRLKNAGIRPDQTFLRRSRLCTEIPRLDLAELLRELREFGETES